MSGARTVLLGALVALAVTIAHEGLIRLVEASGAKQQPAVILVLLLAAFLGLLTALATRALRVPGIVAITALVAGWILVPPLLGAIPSAATDLFAAKSAALSARDALALAVAVVAAAATLGIAAESR